MGGLRQHKKQVSCFAADGQLNMTSIYAVRNDGYKFQQLDLQITDLIGKQPADLVYTKVVNFSYPNLAMSVCWPKLDA